MKDSDMIINRMGMSILLNVMNFQWRRVRRIIKLRMRVICQNIQVDCRNSFESTRENGMISFVVEIDVYALFSSHPRREWCIGISNHPTCAPRTVPATKGSSMNGSQAISDRRVFGGRAIARCTGRARPARAAPDKSPITSPARGAPRDLLTFK
jgi:hypothetical protein